MTASAAAAPQSERVLLIDLSAIFRAAWHANPEGATSVAFEATLNGVRRCREMVQGALVGICCDGRGNWRKALSPTYKAHREKQPEAMYGLFDRVKERLRDDGYLLWEVDSFEADDVIATATTAARSRGHDVVIASHDKDLLQLVDEHVRALRTSTWNEIGIEEVVAKFGVEPAAIGDWLSLVGDASDGIKGAPSVGPKTSTTLLLKHYDLAGIYRKVDALVGGQTMTPEAREIATPGVVAALRDFKADVLLARKLVTLRTDAPIEFDEIYQRREPKAKTKGINLDDNDDIPFGNELADRSEPKDAKFEDARISGAPTEEPKPEPPKENPTTAPSAPSPAAAPPAVATGAATASSGAASPTSPPTPANETRALVVATGVTYERALEPQTATNALRLGEVLYDSRAYTRYPTPQAITAAIMRGREMGLGALASVDSFHFLADLGCLAPKAHLIVAMGENHPDCEFFQMVHSDNEYAEYVTKNRKHPEPIRHRFTIQDAVDAGLCDLKIVPRTAGPKEKDARGNWDKRRKAMLRKQCAVELVRIAYPAAALGLLALEEIGGDDGSR